MQASLSFLSLCALGPFRLDHDIAVGKCSRLLGLMAAASLPLGLLYMRPFLRWIKPWGIHSYWSAFYLLRVSRVSLFASRSQDRCGLPLSGYHNRSLHHDWFGCCLRSQTGLKWCLDGRASLMAHKLPKIASRLSVSGSLPSGPDVLSCYCQEGQYVVSNINRQGASWSCTLNRHMGSKQPPPMGSKQVPFADSSSRSRNLVGELRFWAFSARQ